MKAAVIEVLKRAQKLSLDNSPAILTGVAVAGTITTAILAGKAGFKSAHVIAEAEQLQGGTSETPRERAKERFVWTWKLYIPAAVSGGLTVASLVYSNRISARRGAALATAFTLSERAFDEYKEKVVDQIGVNKEQRLRDDIMRDRVDNDPVSQKEVIITGNGDVLCYETMSGRYFHSNMETLRKAQNDINAQIINQMYASQNDFCRLIGLPPTGYGEEVGWNTDKMLELQFSSVLSEDGKPCLAIGYTYTPIRDYHRFQ